MGWKNDDVAATMHFVCFVVCLEYVFPLFLRGTHEIVCI